HHGPVELWPIGADDGDLVSWLHSKSRQARGISTNDLGNFSPGPRLPDAEILVPERRTRAELRCVSQEQFRERIERSTIGHVGLDPRNRRVDSRLLMVMPRPFREAAMRIPHAATLQRIEGPTSPT